MLASIVTTNVDAVTAPVATQTTVTPVIEVKTVAPTTKVVVPRLSNAEIDSKVSTAATKYGVSAATMRAIINCENRDLIPTLQSGHYYKEGNRWGFSTTTREKSFGIVQIHLPDHPEVSYEQATDADFSIDFLAKYISQGKVRQWSCYKG